MTDKIPVGSESIFWKDVVAHLPGGIGVFSVYPDSRVELLYLNDTYYEMMDSTRQSRAAYTGFDAFRSLEASDRERLVAQLQKAVKENKPVNEDIRVLANEREYRWLNVRAQVADRQEDKALVYLLFTNVNAQHHAQLMANEISKAYRIASGTGNISVWIYRPETGAITQPFSTVGGLGYPLTMPDGPKEILRSGIYEEDKTAYRDMYARIDDGAEFSECTVRVLNRLNGKFEWQHITLTRQTDEETAEKIVIGLTTNVELQKEAEVRYERENRLRQELVKDSVIYYRLNLSTRMIEELYSEAADFSGITLPVSFDKLIEDGLFDGCYQEDLPLLTSMLNPDHMRANYESGKSTETFLYRRYLPGKGLRWLKASIAKLKRVNTDDVIAFFTAIDVDDERKDQILLRDVMNEEIESLITLRVSTHQLRIVKENRNMPGYYTENGENRYFDMTEDFRALLFQNILPEDAAEAAAFIATDNVKNELTHHNILQHTYCVSQPDGSLRRKKVRVFYLDETKQDIIFVRRDITDLFNEQQRQSAAIKNAMDNAKAANEAKSVFLSRMSHDMRTPLNAIIGYSGQTLRDGATEKQKDEFLDDIHSSGEYLLGIINDVLDMTKIESNKMALHPESYSCAAFKQNIETVILPLCQAKGVNFTIDLPTSWAAPVLLDRVRFNQIFVNILSNAVKFTPAGGHITLDGQCEKLSEGKYRGTFRVTDTGCGMSKEFLPHAFDSFSQEYAGQAMHNEQGTGLGLSIVKQLTELMGGKITVQSELQKGSTFVVTLPIQLVQAGQYQPDEVFPENGLRGLHLLLCEDHPMNSKIAVRLLEKEGCTVETAADGQLGLNKFTSSALNSFDAILMDIRMPNMDGLTAAKAIRALPREDAQNVPIIAMTANAFVDDRRASLEAGMNAHVAKPIDPQELYRTIYQFTSHRHVVRTPKVLVVDDIEMNASIIARVLRGHYECIIALSGQQALDELKQNPYIIAVITDVHMPNMDGGELIRRIRQNPAYRRLALIANTEFGNSHVEEEMIRDGADDFIYKPTAPSLILSRLNNVLSKYR